MSTFTVADPSEAFLAGHDATAVSFWVISIAMVAATVFFYAEAGTVLGHWKTSLHVGGLVTLVAAVHYMYMREYWVSVHASPVVYRYIDWSITVPLQMIEFNLILKAANAPIGPAGFWKLLVGTVLMLTFGYCGEVGVIEGGAGFILGLAGWAFILFEIFAGESANASGSSSPAVQQSFQNMRIIVSFGWSIYPAGYFLGTLTTQASSEALNITYNIADFVNKIAFVLACWSCAKAESDGVFRIAELEAQKLVAIENEDFQEAERIKQEREALQTELKEGASDNLAVGQVLGSFLYGSSPAQPALTEGAAEA